MTDPLPLLREALAAAKKAHSDDGTPFLRLDAAYKALDLLRDHGDALLARLAPMEDAK
jgi:hypothetical protein